MIKHDADGQSDLHSVVFINLLHFQEYPVLANFLGDMQKLIPKETIENVGLELFS